MNHVPLGTTGMKVSPICLGTMQFGWSADKETSFAIMDAAWDAGINFFDTADVYSRWAENSYAHKSEEIIGEWLKQSGNRNELILATKVKGQISSEINNQGLSRRHITKQITRSLKALQTDWVDLYQTHSFDPEVPILSTLQTLTDLIATEKVRSIGASNYPAWRLLEAELTSQKYGLARFETLQPPYSLARRHRFEPELQDLCKQYSIAVIPYSPLSAGFLTGKYVREGDLPVSDRAAGVQNRYFNDRGWIILESLQEIASSKGVTTAQAAVAWTLHQSTIVSPIIGATSVEQLMETIQATEISFTAEELESLAEVSNPDNNRIIY